MAGPASDAASVGRQDHDDDDRRAPYCNGGGGSAGGKLRSAGLAAALDRRQKTPYTRPVSGRHASAGPRAVVQLGEPADYCGHRGKLTAWLGGELVGLASRALTSSASFLFASLFGWRSSVVTSEHDANAEGMSLDKTDASVPIHVTDAKDSSHGIYNEREANEQKKEQMVEESHVREVENLLRERTFSRKQYAQFVKLLEMKVSDKTNVLDQGEIQLPRDLNNPQIDAEAPAFGCKDMQKDDKSWASQKCHEVKTTAHRDMEEVITERAFGSGGADGKVRIIEGLHLNDMVQYYEVSSPVDIAKEYMDKRLLCSSECSSLFRTSLNQEGTSIGVNGHRKMDKLSATSLGSEKGIQLSRVGRASRLALDPLNSCETQHVPNLAGRKELFAGVKQDPSSRWVPQHIAVTANREILKRQSNVLESGRASSGLMHNTRLRAISSADEVSRPSMLGVHRVGAQLATSTSAEASFDVCSDEWKAQFARHERNDEMRKKAGTVFTPVKSTETARKILEALDRMTSPPKGKSSPEEIADGGPSLPSEACSSDYDQMISQHVNSPPQCLSHGFLASQHLKNDSILTKPLKVVARNVPSPRKCKGRLKGASSLSLDLPKRSASFPWNTGDLGASKSLPEGIDIELTGLVDSQKCEEINSTRSIAASASPQSQDWSSDIKENMHLITTQASNTFSLSTLPNADDASISVPDLTSNCTRSGSLSSMPRIDKSSSVTSSGFTFPAPTHSHAYLDSLPTPKPIPSPLLETSPTKTVLSPISFLPPIMAATTQVSSFSALSAISSKQIVAEISPVPSATNLDML